jgi:hypothetical protein
MYRYDRDRRSIRLSADEQTLYATAVKKPQDKGITLYVSQNAQPDEYE